MEFFIPQYQLFSEYLNKFRPGQEPENLYTPMTYILSLGGKRIRPIIALLGCEMFSKPAHKALPQALAVELFHNFSLMHDDIMDKAPLRRGKATVHEKWNDTVAILSGDAMLIKAYDELVKSDVQKIPLLLSTFNQMALDVCEGQMMDMNFETREQVTKEEYITMIGKKTSALLGCAVRLGAIAGEAEGIDLELAYEFGYNLGVSFQIKDDYLDAFGNPETFGKQVGGDILANKKTLLYILALELGDQATQLELKNWFAKKEDSEMKIEAVKDIFKATGAVEAIQKESDNYYKKALNLLDQIQVPEEYKQPLKRMAALVMDREY